MISYSINKLNEILNGKLSSNGEMSFSFRGISTDSRSINPEQLFIPLIGEKFDGHQFLEMVEEKGVRIALCQEDVGYIPKSSTMTVLYVKDTFEALHQLASYYRHDVNPIVIAVTGSNGKTTTKDMVSAVCETTYEIHKTIGNLNNHFGLPYTLLSMPSTTKVCIVEMGMNHFGEISLLTKTAQPDVAIISNIGDAHIEFFGTRENIAKAKLEILEGLKKDGTFICFGDEPLLDQAKQLFSGKIVKYGENADNDYKVTDIAFNGETGMTFNVSGKDTTFQIPMLGRYNAINAMAAIAVGDLLQIDEKRIADGLLHMKPSGMRLELEQDPSGLLILNDAYNASPTSMMATLELLEQLPTSRRKWALLGDLLELGIEEEELHREVGRYAASRKLERVFTVGERARWIHDELKRAHSKEMSHFESLDAFASWLVGEKIDDVILLLKGSRGMKLERLIPALRSERKGTQDGA